MRHYNSPLFHPPAAGRPWCAFGIIRAAPVYPEVVFNTFYYTFGGFFLSTPVHARTLAVDFKSTACWANLGALTPLAATYTIQSIYLWDGSVLHTYPAAPSSFGIWPFTFGPRILGASFTTIVEPNTFGRTVFGRRFISPLPSPYFSAPMEWDTLIRADLMSLGASMFTDTFTSEGNLWKPALYSPHFNALATIHRWRLSGRPLTLRRRNRIAPYTGTVLIPPAFPTPTG